MSHDPGQPRPDANDNGVTTPVEHPVDEVEHAEMILRAWVLTYQVNAVGQEAPLRALELAHDALATLTEAAKGGR